MHQSRLHAKSASDFYGIRVGPILALAQVIREHGGNLAAILAMAGLPPDTFAHGNQRLSIDAVGRLCRIIAEECNCPNALLLAGLRFRIGLIDELGELMKHSPTVGEALRNMALRLHLHDQVAVPLLFAIAPGRVALGYSLLDFNTPASDKIQDGTQAILYRLLQELCGSDWQPLAVQFAHVRPANVNALKDAFHCPLHFDAEFSAVVFAAQWLERPIAGADPALYRVLQDQLAVSEQENERDVAEKVRRALKSMVLSGTTSSDGVAGLLGISERTLRRRLADDGTSFQILLNDTLMTLAQQLMTETRLSISDIAAALRYRNLPTFSTAFRRWTGESPSQWKRNRAPK